MRWLIKSRSKPGTDALRTATITAHRNSLDGYPEVTWYSGPLFTDDNRNVGLQAGRDRGDSAG